MVYNNCVSFIHLGGIMVEYQLKRCAKGAILFATECDVTSQITVDAARIDPDSLLQFLKQNQVAPEHLQNVYDDLLFEQSIV